MAMPYTLPSSPSRRAALKLAASSLAAPALLACGGQAQASAAPQPVTLAVQAFAAQEPATINVLLRAESPTTSWAAAHRPDARLFVGSAVKTFILAQFLRDVEAGRNGLSGYAPVNVNDLVRSPGSPVLVGLTGQTLYRSALEAMIAHSDNTGTDIAMAAVGPDRVRALITEAGLPNTQIPDSTRLLFSYLAGAAKGVDLGWTGMQQLELGAIPGLTARADVINDQEAMVSTATEMVTFYQQSLQGKFFRDPKTLREYQRILAMADALWMTVPSGNMAYGKGGSLDWEGFHCLCLAGQMLVGQTTVTFCFTMNWNGGQTSVERSASFIQAAAQVLQTTDESLRR